MCSCRGRRETQQVCKSGRPSPGHHSTTPHRDCCCWPAKSVVNSESLIQNRPVWQRAEYSFRRFGNSRNVEVPPGTRTTPFVPPIGSPTTITELRSRQGCRSSCSRSGKEREVPPREIEEAIRRSRNLNKPLSSIPTRRVDHAEKEEKSDHRRSGDSPSPLLPR